MENLKLKITFDESAKRDILGILDKSVNSDGLIVEKSNPSQPVLTFEGEELTVDDFGGIQKGSEVFIKSDLISLMRLTKINR